MPPTIAIESCPRHGGDSKSVSVGAYYPKPKVGTGGGGRMGGGGALIKTGTVGVQVGGLRGSGAKKAALLGAKDTLEPVYGLDKVCPRVKLTPNVMNSY